MLPFHASSHQTGTSCFFTEKFRKAFRRFFFLFPNWHFKGIVIAVICSVVLLAGCDLQKIENAKEWYCNPETEIYTFRDIHINEEPTVDHRGRIRMDTSGTFLRIAGELESSNNEVDPKNDLLIVFAVEPIDAGGNIFLQKPAASINGQGGTFFRFEGTVTIGSTCPGYKSNIWAMVFCASKLESIQRIWGSAQGKGSEELPGYIASSMDQGEAITIEAASLQNTPGDDVIPEADDGATPSAAFATDYHPITYLNCDTTKDIDPVIQRDGIRNGKTTRKIVLNLAEGIVAFQFEGKNIGEEYCFYIRNAQGIDRIDFEVKGKDKNDSEAVVWRRLDKPPEDELWKKITLKLSGTKLDLGENEVNADEILFHLEGIKGGTLFFDGVLE